ncbi:MAG TPA: heme biosynthesis HemY N-terminal domain-containing protein [Alphaproteobacteria bacterium]|nr:heme biosynthesis HemY N-terminal domain-containing protein [Alphaproteobacteria bacterium]
MRKILIFLLKLVILVGVAVWVAERPGTVTLRWLNWELHTTVGVLILVVVVAATLAALLYRLWRLTLRSPRDYLSRRRARRRERGYRALTQGMVAVAAGDAEEAKRQARRAGALLDEPPLTLLLAAQAAQLDGDEEAARDYFTRMIERDETAFLGLRGLLMQAVRGGDDAAALELAERAYKERPETPWLVRTLLDLQIRRGQWEQANEALAQAQRIRLVGPDQAKRQRSALLVERARALQQGGETGEALRLAREAHRLDPGFVPAAAQLAGLLIPVGKVREAGRVIENAWNQSPHPALAQAYAALRADEDPLARARRFERLGEVNRSTRDARLELAAAAMGARLWGEAKRHLEVALELGATARAYRMLAELEEGERGDPEAAARWLRKAAEAAPDPAWVCERCGAAHQSWSARCEGCGSFATLAWRQPNRTEAPALAVPERPRLPETAGAGEREEPALAPESVAAARLVT